MLRSMFQRAWVTGQVAMHIHTIRYACLDAVYLIHICICICSYMLQGPNFSRSCGCKISPEPCILHPSLSD
jgi:hypothetical protein